MHACVPHLSPAGLDRETACGWTDIPTGQDSNVTGQYRSDGRIESNTIAYLDSTQMNIANYESGAGHSPDCGSAAGSPPVWA